LGYNAMQSIEVDWRFKGAYKTTQHYIPEGCHLHERLWPLSSFEILLLNPVMSHIIPVHF
jgi:hypothetical protein